MTSQGRSKLTRFVDKRTFIKNEISIETTVKRHPLKKMSGTRHILALAKWSKLDERELYSK